MAATKIADVIVPEVFNPYVREETIKNSALFQSGIVQTVADLQLGGLKGGTTIAMPFWKDLGGAEEILSDTTPLGVDKVTSGQDLAVLHARGKAWGVNDLAKALAGSDPMAAIADRVVTYWDDRHQIQLLSTLEGIFASGDLDAHIHDISGETGEDALLTGNSVVDALYKMGDQSGKLTSAAFHSTTVAALVKQGLIEFRNDAEGNPTLPFYMGKRVIQTDEMPVLSGGVYVSYLFGAGAFGYADADAPVPTETDRDSLQGEDILINRKHFVLHPRGVAWQGDPAGVSPTNVELEDGDNWNLVWQEKNVRIVQVRHLNQVTP
jgi:hypothetical protein